MQSRHTIYHWKLRVVLLNLIVISACGGFPSSWVHQFAPNLPKEGMILKETSLTTVNFEFSRHCQGRFSQGVRSALERRLGPTALFQGQIHSCFRETKRCVFDNPSRIYSHAKLFSRPLFLMIILTRSLIKYKCKMWFVKMFVPVTECSEYPWMDISRNVSKWIADM